MPEHLGISATLVNDGREVCIQAPLSQLRGLQQELDLLLAYHPKHSLMLNVVEALKYTLQRQIDQAGHAQDLATVQLPLLIAICTFYHLYQMNRLQAASKSELLSYMPDLMEQAIAENSKEAARNYRQWFQQGIEFSAVYNPLFLLLKSSEYQNFKPPHDRRRSKSLHVYLNQIPEHGKDYQAAAFQLKLHTQDIFAGESEICTPYNSEGNAQMFVSHLVERMQQHSWDVSR